MPAICARSVFRLRLVRTGVDLAKEIPLLHGLPLFESNLDKLPSNLAAHDDVVEGNDRADAPQVDRNVVALHRRATTLTGGGGAAASVATLEAEWYFVASAAAAAVATARTATMVTSLAVAGFLIIRYSLIIELPAASTGGGTGVRAWH